MKTKTWIALLGILLLLSAGASLAVLLPGEDAAEIRVFSQGELLYTLPLSIDRELNITTPSGGENTITISGGAVAVTRASCPDHYCMHRGYCTGGSSIVCLPNRLVIEFSASQDVDFSLG